MARTNSESKTTDKYRSLYPAYVSYSIKLKTLLTDIMDASEIKYHLIETRAKDVKSFGEKTTRPGKTYRDPLNDITDLCGARIIVYYADDVEKVCRLLKEEFSVNEENLTRQPNLLEFDRFGYLSAHYIVALSGRRSQLVEWMPFASFVCEVQVRTVIQHAWSAVSHALQYKQETSVPSKLQRRLHRIAGIFELADEEFVSIRDMRLKIGTEIDNELSAGNTEIELDPSSIVQFLSAWKGRDDLLDPLRKSGFNFYSEDQHDHTDEIYDLAVLGGISTISDLEKALNIDYKKFFEDIYIEVYERGTNYRTSADYAVVLVLILYNKDRVTPDFLVRRNFSKDVATGLIKAAKLSKP